MSSLMWYIYDFARKAWADAFTNAKTSPEIADKPQRFRDFPKVNKEYCIGVERVLYHAHLQMR